MIYSQNNSLDFSKLKFGIYARVSNESQVEKGWSLDFQENILKGFIQQNNYDLFSCWIEPGISGDEFEKRTSLIRLLDDIESKKVNCILLFRVDRLSRDMKVGTKIAEILKRNNCLVLSMEGCGLLDLNTPYGEEKYYDLVNRARTEVHILSDRISSGKKLRATKGLYINSNSVYGYSSYYDQHSGERLLKVNDYESHIVEEIFEWFNNDMSEYKIAKKLNEQKTPCKRFGKWRQSTVHSILTNILYIGKIRYGIKKGESVEIYDGVHQRIIDDNTFHMAQEKIAKKKSLHIKKQPGENSYFSSILFCPNCGSLMNAKQIKAKDKSSIRYYCKNKCGQKSIKHLELESKLVDYFETALDICIDNQDILLYETNNKILSIEKKIEAYKNKITYKEYLFSENCIDYQTYIKQMDILNQKIEDLENAKEELIKKSNTLNKIDKEIIKLNFLSFSNLWYQISPFDRKIFINSFVKKIYINNIEGFINIDKIEFIKL